MGRDWMLGDSGTPTPPSAARPARPSSLLAAELRREQLLQVLLTSAPLQVANHPVQGWGLVLAARQLLTLASWSDPALVVAILEDVIDMLKIEDPPAPPAPG